MTVTHLSGTVHGSPTVETWTDPFAAGSTVGTTARAYEVRIWQTPWAHAPAFTQLIPAWTAHTPQGTWIEVAVRVRGPAPSGVREPGTVTSDWAVVARWSSGIAYDWTTGTPDWHSHSVNGQELFGLAVDTDTVDVTGCDLGGPATQFQARVRLFRPAHSGLSAPGPWPEVTRVSVLTRAAAAADPTPPGAAAGGASALDILLPEFSQRLHGAQPGMGAGDSWCSATSLAMVAEFWRADGRPDLFPAYRPDEPAPEVPATVARVWDFAYGGAGNWAFNVALLAARGFDAYVESFDSLDALARVVAGGEPVIASVRFTKADLPEAGYETGGHLLVVSGFDEAGDVRVHDPAAGTNDDVRRTYPRAAFARAWLDGSHGLVYRARPSLAGGVRETRVRQ